MTPTQVRTTALCAVSAQFIYHFTYDFGGLGVTRRRRAIVLAAWRADMVMGRFQLMILFPFAQKFDRRKFGSTTSITKSHIEIELSTYSSDVNLVE